MTTERKTYAQSVTEMIEMMATLKTMVRMVDATDVDHWRIKAGMKLKTAWTTLQGRLGDAAADPYYGLQHIETLQALAATVHVYTRTLWGLHQMLTRLHSGNNDDGCTTVEQAMSKLYKQLLEEVLSRGTYERKGMEAAELAIYCSIVRDMGFEGYKSLM